MGTLRGTQIHPCFYKSLIASGSGKEGWLWGGNSQASATEPELRIRRDGGTETDGRGWGPGDGKKVRWRDGATETEELRNGGWRDGKPSEEEMERLRSRARTWQATERDACSNRNVKREGEEARPGTRGVKPGYEIRNVSKENSAILR